MFSHALLTDLYQLTMAAGYLNQGKWGESATFDLYYRRNPFRGGYAIAAGLETAIHAVTGLRFGARRSRLPAHAARRFGRAGLRR